MNNKPNKTFALLYVQYTIAGVFTVKCTSIKKNRHYSKLHKQQIHKVDVRHILYDRCTGRVQPQRELWKRIVTESERLYQSNVLDCW